MLLYHLNGEEQTQALAARLAPYMRPGSIILLNGPLGAGKTTFVRGLAQGLGLSADYDIVSPTFTLLNIYPARLPLYHADCYRTCAQDMFEMELLEQTKDGVLAVEWPHENSMFSDEHCWRVELDYQGLAARKLKLQAPPAFEAQLAAAALQN